MSRRWPRMCRKCAERISAMLKNDLDLDISPETVLARYQGMVIEQHGTVWDGTSLKKE
jgi:hypothetical protein